MPEPYWPKSKHSYTLSMAERNGSMAYMRCRYCKVGRYYLLADLRELLGDIDCDDVTDRHLWRCEGCNKTRTVVLELVYPSATEKQSMTVRRLARIKVTRVPVWRDEEGSYS